MFQIEPSADQRIALKELRAIYIAAVAEGFTPEQAMEIIGHIIRAHAGEAGK